MVRSKSIIFITAIWLAILLSGCIVDKNIEPAKTTPVITATPTATPLMKPIPEVTPSGTVIVESPENITSTVIVESPENITSTVIVESPVNQTPGPTATTSRELLSGTLYVTARMMKLSNWSTTNETKYGLETLKVNVMNQINTPLTIKAQILSGDQILEEKTFTLEKQDSSVEFSNENMHFINNTNVNLRLLIKGYLPIEYKFIEVDQLN